MNTAKARFTVPSCKGCACPSYINNHSRENYTARAKGRVLYFGERYCLHGRKAIQFRKADPWHRIPSWCPRKTGYLTVRRFVRRPSTYWEDWAGLPVILPNPKDYRLSHTTRIYCTPLQLYRKMRSDLEDHMALLGWISSEYEVIEIDTGVALFYLFKSEKGWQQRYSFDRAKSDLGVIGSYQVNPHQDQDLDHYSAESAAFEEHCIGYIRGHFGGGPFRYDWRENRPDMADSDFHKEHEDLLYTLQSEGFLHSIEALGDYCLKRYWARLINDDGSTFSNEYGFFVTCEKYRFYLRLTPSTESNYNVYLFSYAATENNGGIDG